MIFAQNIDIVWRALLSNIMEFGEPIDDKVILDEPIVVKIATKGREPDIPPLFNWGEMRMDKYVEQFMSSDNSGFAYTYGERMFDYNTDSSSINQVECAITELRKDKKSRHAIISLYNPFKDVFSESIPCMQWIQYNVDGDNRLRTTALFRSHDITQAFPANLYAIWTLSAYVAREVGMLNGDIYCISNNAHIYIDRDMDLIKKVYRGCHPI